MKNGIFSELNVRHLRQLAGERSFARGTDYFHRGCVSELRHSQGKLVATVKGTSDYTVGLWADEEDLRYSCTCPLGEEDHFCKHCVAAALAWIETDHRHSENNLRSFVERMEKNQLVEIVLREAEDNERLHNYLSLEAARQKPAGVDLAAYRRLIKKAIRITDFVDYHSALDYSQGVQTVIDSIEALLTDGHAAVVVQLTEYALSLLEEAIGGIDDSAGTVGDLLDDLQDLHYGASKQLGADPEDLARRLFAWEMKSGWGVFSGAAATYADVLGAKGLAEYRRLAEAEWTHVRALRPNDDDAEKYGRRFRITKIMEALTDQLWKS